MKAIAPTEIIPPKVQQDTHKVRLVAAAPSEVKSNECDQMPQARQTVSLRIMPAGPKK
jgi:hypothetical protein